MRYDDLSEVTIAAHDRQRHIPAEAQRTLVKGLCSHLRGRGWCLDAGVGTGSVAIPLARAGVPIVGVDLSRAMLDALRVKCGGGPPFPLVRGDLTRLPFRDAVFGAALAANVFHLIAAWQTAVVELVRVVRPGGLLLINLGGGGPSTAQGATVLDKFREFLGGAWPAYQESAGPRNAAEFEARLAAHGASARPSLEVRFQQVGTLDAAITRLEHNVFARPATIDQAALHRAAAATRSWARQQFGPLDVPWSSERIITYRIYQVRQ